MHFQIGSIYNPLGICICTCGDKMAESAINPSFTGELVNSNALLLKLTVRTGLSLVFC